MQRRGAVDDSERLCRRQPYEAKIHNHLLCGAGVGLSRLSLVKREWLCARKRCCTLASFSLAKEGQGREGGAALEIEDGYVSSCRMPELWFDVVVSLRFVWSRLRRSCVWVGNLRRRKFACLLAGRCLMWICHPRHRHIYSSSAVFKIRLPCRWFRVGVKALR